MVRTSSLIGHWDQLHVFHVVAGCGGVNRAAGILNVHPSAISRQIRQLEEVLHVTLFERHSKGLKLTEAGRALERSVGDVAHRLRTAEAEVSRIGEADDSVAGLLVIAVPYGFGAFFLIPILNRFLSRYPQIAVRLMMVDNELSLDLHEVDVAIRVTAPNLDGLMMTRLGSYQPMLVADPDYIKRCGTPRVVDDLLHHRLIVLQGENVQLNRQLDWIYTAGIVRSRLDLPPLVVSDMNGVWASVCSGLGIGAVPSYFPMKGIERVLPDLVLPDVSVYFLTTRTRSKLSRIQALRLFVLDEARVTFGQKSEILRKSREA